MTSIQDLPISGESTGCSCFMHTDTRLGGTYIQRSTLKEIEWYLLPTTSHIDGKVTRLYGILFFKNKVENLGFFRQTRPTMPSRINRTPWFLIIKSEAEQIRIVSLDWRGLKNRNQKAYTYKEKAIIALGIRKSQETNYSNQAEGFWQERETRFVKAAAKRPKRKSESPFLISFAFSSDCKLIDSLAASFVTE